MTRPLMKACLLCALALVLLSPAVRLRSQAKRPARALKAAAGLFPSTQQTPPASYRGPLFQLSQAYPRQSPTGDTLPWKQYDFHTQANDYLMAIRDYVYAGNINRGNDPNGNSLDWVVQSNPVRTWYNMPWRDYGSRGREFVHGMTQEFPESQGSLDVNQKCAHNTYAIAMYNPIAGYTVGQVWPSASQGPQLQKANFAEGALVVKLLFTTAPTSDVPGIAGAYQWNGNVTDYVSFNKGTSGCTTSSTLSVQPVSLIQMDIAVKDLRATETNWVFGTFVYNGKAAGDSVWDKMIPLGLMWGNDPQLVGTGSDQTPTQSVILNGGLYPHLGCHNRLTGPVDNPKSACMSCHMTGQYAAASSSLPNTTGGVACDAQPNAAYWQNKLGGILFQKPTTPGQTWYSTDFSMELASAAQNYHIKTGAATFSADGKSFRLKKDKRSQPVIRRTE